MRNVLDKILVKIKTNIFMFNNFGGGDPTVHEIILYSRRGHRGECDASALRDG
jgi:hypothetical protein